MYKRELESLSKEQLVELVNQISKELDIQLNYASMEMIEHQSLGLFNLWGLTNIFNDSTTKYSVIYSLKKIIRNATMQEYSRSPSGQDCIPE